MKLNEKMWIWLTMGTALTGLASRASTNTETFSATYGSSSAPVAINGSGFPVDLRLPQFETALGNLTGIEVTLNSTGVLLAEVANVGAATEFTGAEAAGTITLVGPDGVNSMITLATTPFSGSIGGGSVATPALALGPPTAGSGLSQSYVGASDFGAYEGSQSGGTFDFVLNATFSGTYSGNGPFGLSFTGSPSDYGSVAIEYTYVTPVPEPGNLCSLTILCMGGYAGFDRMRRWLRSRGWETPRNL